MSIILLIELAIVAFFVVAHWKVFVKAGQPGWASLIPIYNCYVWLKISGKPGWWLILLLIPMVNLVVVFLCCLAIAKAFGKSDLFGVGLFFLSFIFVPILAFGDAAYAPPQAPPAAAAPAPAAA